MLLMMKLNRCLRTRDPFSHHGFTLVEILVAVVILSVGLLGMAAMTIMVMRGNKMAKRQTEAITMLQSEMERIKDADFQNIGDPSVTDCTSEGTVGLGNFGTVCYRKDLNAQGLKDGEGGVLPFPYNLFLRVCDSNIDPGDETPDTGLDLCGTSAHVDGWRIGGDYPPDLTCPGGLNVGEVEIRLVVSWRRYESGATSCRSLNLNSVVVHMM